MGDTTHPRWPTRYCGLLTRAAAGRSFEIEMRSGVVTAATRKILAKGSVTLRSARGPEMHRDRYRGIGCSRGAGKIGLWQ
ncbi:hypothetical protein NDU88_006053 [Pleurodeles waltl]|uniref:Uncharacterized protein n=1 Tax=Pleurodeles waltl TaxID=8319 RepID=A0AAV7TWI8_PLEWA|nr:hypothetical protein NDU88_006053 [Pleurodeles waltl]